MENNGSTNNTNLKAVEYVAMEETQEVKIKQGVGSNDEKHCKLKGCGKIRTALEKVLIILLLLVTLLCILLIVVLLIRRPAKDDRCMTTECVQLAGKLLSNLNPSIDPCDDFFEFTCGGWKERNTISEDRSRTSVLDQIETRLLSMCKDLLEEPVTTSSEPDVFRKARHFYTACMNEETIDERGVDPLRTLMSRFGGWPVADVTFDENSWELVDTLIAIKKTIGQHMFFVTDPKFEDIYDKKFYRLRIDQIQLGLGYRENYLPETMNKGLLEQYLMYMSRLAAEMREDHDQAEAMVQMNETFQFETKLAEIQGSTAERRDVKKLINQMTIANLSDSSPNIDWLRYFREVLDNDGITAETVIYNLSPRYFEQLGKLVEVTPKRIIANYLMVRVAMDAAEYLSTRIRQIRGDFMRITKGETAAKPRWETCIRHANQQLPQAVGALFVQNHFNEESKITANEMYRNIRQALTETIDGTEWMDEKTQQKALEKIKYTNELIGYITNISSTERLNELYGDIEISPDTYFDNIMKTTTAKAKKDSAMYGKVINVSDSERKWADTSPVSANAWYYQPLNSIFVPAGILQPPFYSKDFPKSLNYGGIGVVIGHELSHGFDIRGRDFGKDGRLEQWWSEESYNSYKDRAQCLVDQYSSYRIPEININVDGARTLSENIADNGGIKAAFLGYKKWVAQNGAENIQLPGLNYTSEQLFFINFGQFWCSLHKPEDLRNSMYAPYPPSQYRVIGTVSNSKVFAETFKCKKNSAMNPTKKCELW
ncbi:neprilysin-1-like isoform X1 [Amphiura filiformis]|uniref:neprilysin-1-like isoform X1 n=1 Tax=Amphiura filiformis TaxID=82378 RepID=UPI003B2279D9